MNLKQLLYLVIQAFVCTSYSLFGEPHGVG